MGVLLNHLRQVLAPYCAAPHWYLGFSGGLDSSVLLHALAHLRHHMDVPPLTAVHVHHGLQAVGDHWPEHCHKQCQALGVEFRVLPVQVSESGQGLEAAAREARHAAWHQLLGAGDVLLTAQHADDQAETLMFRLLRGAGVKGLSAMPMVRALGAGQLLRPILGVRRAELEQYAQQHGLTWIEDPSNQDVHYSRNYLRHEVLPRVQARWPQYVRQLGRTAAHMQEAQLLLEECAEQDLALCRADAEGLAWLPLPRLDLAALKSLSELRQRNLLRHWLSGFVPLPDTAHWVGWTQLRDATSEATPCWQLEGGSLQRGSGRVWFVPDDWLEVPSLAILAIRVADWISLPSNGQIRIQGEDDASGLSVRYRQGGERINLPKRGHRDLKRLLNEAQVPTFVRPRLPLLWQGDELVAVANLPECSHPHWKLDWLPSGLS